MRTAREVQGCQTRPTERVRTGIVVSEYSPEKLRVMREAAGLSKEKLARAIGKSDAAIRKYEAGKVYPDMETWEKLQAVLLDTSPPPPEFSFDAGHRYTIWEKAQGGQSHKDYRASDRIEYVFEYVGKAGIHHFFREVRNGWTRTYTDVQLMGKQIKEVFE